MSREEGTHQNETIVTDDKILQMDSRFNHIIHKYAVSSESPFFSYFSFSLLFSFSLFSLFPSQSYSAFSHNLTICLDLLFILDTFRTYLFYHINLSRCMMDSKITRRIIIQDFLSGFSLFFIYFPFFSHIFSHFLVCTLSLSLARTLSWSFTLRDLLRSLYLTMIYLHITYTSTSQLFGSPFLTYMILLLHPSRRGRGCLWCIMYDYEACISIINDANHTMSRAFPQWCLWTLTIEIYSLISPTLHTSHASDTFIATSNILTILRDWQ